MIRVNKVKFLDYIVKMLDDYKPIQSISDDDLNMCIPDEKWPDYLEDMALLVGRLIVASAVHEEE